MDILINIPDTQWEEFKQLSREAVETQWNESYEDFLTYIMTVNIDTYMASQRRKQEKKLKRALAEYEESMAKETIVSTEKPAALPAKKPQAASVKPRPPEKPHVALPERKEESMTSKEIAERIARLEDIPVKQRTLAEAQELHDLLIQHKKNERKKSPKKASAGRRGLESLSH